MRVTAKYTIKPVVMTSAALILWPSAPMPASVFMPSIAANKPAQPIQAAKSPIISRQAQQSTGNDPAKLLAKIQEALGSPNPDNHEIVFARLLAALVRADPLAASDTMLQPLKSRALYVVGDTWSPRQNWAEGALEQTEAMLQKHFGLNVPGWIAS